MHRVRRIALISRGTTYVVYTYVIRVYVCIYIYTRPLEVAKEDKEVGTKPATVNAAPLRIYRESDFYTLFLDLGPPGIRAIPRFRTISSKKDMLSITPRISTRFDFGLFERVTDEIADLND